MAASAGSCGVRYGGAERWWRGLRIVLVRRQGGRGPVRSVVARRIGMRRSEREDKSGGRGQGWLRLLSWARLVASTRNAERLAVAGERARVAGRWVADARRRGRAGWGRRRGRWGRALGLGREKGDWAGPRRGKAGWAAKEERRPR